MKANHHPKERFFLIMSGEDKGDRITLRKRKNKWHIVSSSKHMSYSQEELDRMIKEKVLDERS